MGHGPGRELQTSSGPDRELNPELVPRLNQAMEIMDQLDPAFKENRENERYSQLSKSWNRKVKEITELGRQVCKALIKSHQVSLDVGVEGGGTKAKPWIEETGGRFPRMYLAVKTGGKIDVLMGDEKFAEGTVDDVDYEWYEKMVAAWLIKCVQAKRAEHGG